MPGPFAFAMLAVLFLSIIVRDKSMVTVIALLMWDWMLCVMLAGADGNGTGWFGLGCIDLSVAMLLLMFADRRWQYAVAGLFVAMIACHVVRGALGTMFTDHAYLTALSWLAWAQVACVVCRGGYVVAAVYRNRDSGRGRVCAVPADAARACDALPSSAER